MKEYYHRNIQQPWSRTLSAYPYADNTNSGIAKEAYIKNFITKNALPSK